VSTLKVNNQTIEIYSEMFRHDFNVTEFTDYYYNKNTKYATFYLKKLEKSGYLIKQSKPTKRDDLLIKEHEKRSKLRGSKRKKEKCRGGRPKQYIVITPAGVIYALEQKIKQVDRFRDYIGEFLNNFANLEIYYENVKSLGQTLIQIKTDPNLEEWSREQTNKMKEDMITKLIALQHFLTSRQTDYEKCLEFIGELTAKLIESRDAVTKYDIEKSSVHGEVIPKTLSPLPHLRETAQVEQVE